MPQERMRRERVHRQQLKLWRQRTTQAVARPRPEEVEASSALASSFAPLLPIPAASASTVSMVPQYFAMCSLEMARFIFLFACAISVFNSFTFAVFLLSCRFVDSVLIAFLPLVSTSISPLSLFLRQLLQ